MWTESSCCIRGGSSKTERTTRCWGRRAFTTGCISCSLQRGNALQRNADGLQSAGELVLDGPALLHSSRSGRVPYLPAGFQLTSAMVGSAVLARVSPFISHIVLLPLVEWRHTMSDLPSPL